jgi:hypothetical protein
MVSIQLQDRCFIPQKLHELEEEEWSVFMWLMRRVSLYVEFDLAKGSCSLHVEHCPLRGNQIYLTELHLLQILYSCGVALMVTKCFKAFDMPAVLRPCVHLNQSAPIFGPYDRKDMRVGLPY